MLELVVGLHYRNARIVKLVVGLHYKCFNSNQEKFWGNEASD